MAFTVTSTRIYSNPEDEDLAKSWGLLGFFPGDEELLQEMKWVQQELDISNNSNSNSNSQKMKRLYQLLDRLPMASRQALATQILAHHTQRDEIIQELLDYAFEPQEQHAQEQDNSSKKDAFHDPDDFVLLWTDSTRFMNPHRYHIFQTVLLLLNFVSVPVALRLCRAYFASASTQHTGALLAYCTKQDTELFSNQELQRLFEAAPLLVQKQVLTTCRSMAPSSSPVDNNHDSSSSGGGGSFFQPNHPRQEFLLHVWQTMYDLDPQIIFWCSSDVVQKYLLRGPTTSNNNKEKPSSSSFKTNQRLVELGMQRWSAHAAVYTLYLQQRLTEEPNPLLRGTLWKGQLLPLLVKAKSTLQWSHSQTHAIQSLLMDYTVLELAHDTPRLAREHLQRLAVHYQQSNGKDPTALLQFPHIQRVLLSPIRPLTKPERLQKTLQAIQETNWKDFQTFHNGISYNNLPFQSVFQQATLVDLWTAITGKNQMMPPDNDSLSSPKDEDHIRLMQFFYRSDFTSHRERSFTIDALFEWGEWHLRSTPDKLTTQQLEWFATNHHYQSQFDDAECTQKKAILKQLWNAWYQSLTSRYFTNGLVNTTIERVLEAQRTCLTMDEKSKITLDVRYFHVLFKIAMRGIETMPHWTAEGQLDHWKRLMTLMGKLEECGHLPVVANLNATISHVLERQFFCRLKELLFFDLPSDPKRYAKTDSQMHVFQNHAAWIAVYLVKHPNSDALRKEFVSILINILKQATNGGHHDSEALVEITDPQTNKIVFDYYDAYITTA